jgi:hypothetical protein
MCFLIVAHLIKVGIDWPVCDHCLGWIDGPAVTFGSGFGEYRYHKKCYWEVEKVDE